MGCQTNRIPIRKWWSMMYRPARTVFTTTSLSSNELVDVLSTSGWNTDWFDPMFGSTHGLKLVIPMVKLYCITRMFVCRMQASWLNCTHWHSTLRNTKYHRDQKFSWCVSSCCPRLPVTSYEKAFETSTKMLLGGSHSMTGQQAWPDLASPRFRESPWTIQSTWWATALLVA